MRKPGLVFLAIAIMLINACGKVTSMKAASVGPMSETDALNLLSDVPMDPMRTAIGTKKKVSVAELMALIQKLVAEGKIKVPAGMRSATGGGVDLSQLQNIFTILNQGGIGSIFSLANAIIGMNGGSTTGSGTALQNILNILTQLAPLIATIAPQFAPIVAALTTIIPLVITFINLFKKPSAALHWGVLLPTC